MFVSVEISMYPLNNEYLPSIKKVVDAFNKAENVTVKTNAMSTQIVGEFDIVMALLNTELKSAFAQLEAANQTNKAVFVCKFINGQLPILEA